MPYSRTFIRRLREGFCVLSFDVGYSLVCVLMARTWRIARESDKSDAAIQKVYLGTRALQRFSEVPLLSK